MIKQWHMTIFFSLLLFVVNELNNFWYELLKFTLVFSEQVLGDKCFSLFYNKGMTFLLSLLFIFKSNNLYLCNFLGIRCTSFKYFDLLVYIRRVEPSGTISSFTQVGFFPNSENKVFRQGSRKYFSFRQTQNNQY